VAETDKSLVYGELKINFVRRAVYVNRKEIVLTRACLKIISFCSFYPN